MTTTATEISREIKYNRANRDYDCYVDGQYVGSAANYSDGETLCNQVAYDLIADGQCLSATQLDGGSDADEVAAEITAMLDTWVVSCSYCGAAHTDAEHHQSWVETGAAPAATLDVAEAQGILYNINAAHRNGLDTSGTRAWLGERGYPTTFADIGDVWIPAGNWWYDADTLVIRAEEPVQQAAVLAHQEPLEARLYCLICLGRHDTKDCPLKRGDHRGPIDVTPLLNEVDALLEQLTPHPGPNCYCPDCMRRAVVLTATSYVTKLRFDAGLICQYCGDDHADSDCTQKRPLLAPRVCDNCQGRHSIQACDEIRAALFAA